MTRAGGIIIGEEGVDNKEDCAVRNKVEDVGREEVHSVACVMTWVIFFEKDRVDSKHRGGYT